MAAPESSTKDLDLTKETKELWDDNSPKLGLSEKDRLKFAKQNLFCLFLLVILVFGGSYFAVGWVSTNPELIKLVYTILDITKTVVPATVTLVLGFYFGRKDT